MDTVNWHRVWDLFHTVVELEAAERDARLDRECAESPELRNEIESLLAAHRMCKSFLNEPVIESDLRSARETPADSLLGCRIGRYRVRRLIGRGTTSRVYEATQDAPSRLVALKVLRHQQTIGGAKRFRHEAHALGLLLHPGIAQIYEAGTETIEDQPRSFIAMELVDGAPLLRFAAERTLNVTQRLRLIVEICRALELAHAKGVVHRDLKPSNILVTSTGRPKILDFGIARLTDSDLLLTTLETQVGQLLGTIPYMSPEQAGGRPDRVDARSDVYSLGVVLFELLTGEHPHDLAECEIPRALSMIASETPRRLSRVKPELRGDIETIVEKALEHDPDRRYQSASELRADIERSLRAEPIRAKPATYAYQLKCFVKRNTLLTGAILLSFVTLAAGTVGTSLGYVEARHQWTIANDRAEDMRRARDAAMDHAESSQSQGIFVRRFCAEMANHSDTASRERTLRALDRALEDSTDVVNWPVRTVQSYLTAAMFYSAVHETETADSCYWKAHEFAERELPEAHATRIEAMKFIALRLRRAGRDSEALEMGRRIYELSRQSFGAAGGPTVFAAISLGHSLNTSGSPDEQEQLLRTTLTDSIEINGTTHEITEHLRTTLLVVIDRRHGPEAAVELAEAWREDVRTHTSPGDRLRVIASYKVARHGISSEKPDHAQEAIRDAVRECLHWLQSDDDVRPTFAAGIPGVMLELDMREELVTFVNTTLDLIEQQSSRQTSRSWPLVMSAMDELNDIDFPDDVFPTLVRAEQFAAIDDEVSVRNKDSLTYWLGQSFIKQGKVEQAIETHRRRLAQIEQAGDDLQRIARQYYFIGKYLMQVGDNDAAELHLTRAWEATEAGGIDADSSYPSIILECLIEISDRIGKADQAAFYRDISAQPPTPPGR